MKSVRESSDILSSPSRTKTRVRASAAASGDLGRIVQSNSALLTFAGLTLGVFVSRKFFVLPLAVACTLAQEMAKARLSSNARRPRRR